MADDSSSEPTSVLLPGRQSLLVRLTCKPGMRAAMLDRLNSYADGLAEEPGTEMYVVSLDPENDAIVWLYEIFRDEDAQLAHRSAHGFADLVGTLPDLLDGPPAMLAMEPLRMSLQQQLLTEDWTL